MDFSEEENRPIYVTQDFPPRDVSTAGIDPVASALPPVSLESHPGACMVSPKALRRYSGIPEHVTIVTDDHAECELIIARLKANGKKRYRFLDGTVYTGDEAALEVARGSADGRYFMERERAILRIVRKAVAEGKL